MEPTLHAAGTWQDTSLAVVPIFVGPLQALLALLPAILLGLVSLLAAAFRPRTILLFLKLLWRQKLVVVPAVAVTAVLAIYGPGLLPESASGTATMTGAVGYPAFRGGPTRRGWVAGAGDPTVDERHWTVTDPHETFYSSPAVVGHYVFAITAHVTPFSASGEGRLLCLDARTGRQIWQDEIPDLRGTFSSPAVSGEHLVIGEGLHFTNDARVICVDSATGKTRWMHRTRSHVESSPAIADGRAFIGAGDDGLYCFALEPDADGNADILWHAPGDEYPDCEASPVAYDGRVYMGLGFHGNAVVCLDAKTGEELWKTPTPYPVFGSPSVINGRLYVGMGNGNFVKTAEQVWTDERKKLRATGEYTEAELAEIAEAWRRGGAVWSLDLDTGSRLWSCELPDTVLGSVVGDAQHLYFGGRDGVVYKIDASDGAVVRTWNAGAPLLACPALGEDHVYFTSGAGMLFALRRDTLEPVFESALWDSPPASTDLFLSSPSIAHGRAFVGTPALGLLAVGRAGEPPLPVWSGTRGGPGSGGIVGRAAPPDRLAVVARYPAEPDTSVAVASPVALGDDAVYVVTRQAGESGSQTFALSALVAEEADGGTTMHSRWTQGLSGEPVGSPVLRDGRLFVLTAGDAGTAVLTAVACDTGQSLWSAPAPADARDPQIADGFLLWRDGGGLTVRKVREDRPPSDAWTLPVAVVGEPHAKGPRVAVATASPDELHLLDLATGRALWRIALKSRPRSGPVIHRLRVFLASDDGLASFSLLDGTRQWQEAVGPVEGPLIVRRDVIVASAPDGTRTIVNAADGAILGQTGPSRSTPLVSDEYLITQGSRGFTRIPLKQPDRRPDVWMRWSSRSHGDILYAPVMRDGRLVLTTTRGVVLAAKAEKQ